MSQIDRAAMREAAVRRLYKAAFAEGEAQHRDYSNRKYTQLDAASRKAKADVLDALAAAEAEARIAKAEAARAGQMLDSAVHELRQSQAEGREAANAMEGLMAEVARLREALTRAHGFLYIGQDARWHVKPSAPDDAFDEIATMGQRP